MFCGLFVTSRSGVTGNRLRTDLHCASVTQRALPIAYYTSAHSKFSESTGMVAHTKKDKNVSTSSRRVTTALLEAVLSECSLMRESVLST